MHTYAMTPNRNLTQTALLGHDYYQRADGVFRLRTIVPSNETFTALAVHDTSVYDPNGAVGLEARFTSEDLGEKKDLSASQVSIRVGCDNPSINNLII